MNAIENMLMQALLQSCSDKPVTPEEVMGNKTALEAVQQIDPERARGVIILAAVDEVNDEGRGVRLVTSMAGSERTVEALLRTATAILQIQHLQRCHSDEVAKDPLLSALLAGGSEIDSKDVHEHFGGCGNPSH